VGRNPSANVKLAPKKIIKSLVPLGRLLASIGKPVYFVLSRTIIAFLFVVYVTGYFTRVTLTNFFNFLLRILYLLFINLPRITAIYLAREASRIKIKKLVLLLRKILFLCKSSIRSLVRVSRSLLKKISSFQVRKRVAFFLLKLRLFRLRILSLFPKIRIAKLKLFLLSLGIFIVVLIPPTYLFWKLVIKNLPSPDELVSRKVGVSTKIYDRGGVLLYKIFKNENRTPVALSQIPIHVRLATLAIEDAEFYSHPGFSVRGIVRAGIKILEGKEITGGSTITQQLVKNALLTPEKTLVRKLREIVVAVQVERTFTKDQILEMYLNETPYGGTAYGIQEAARVYFGKDVDRLSLGEAALLAGLPKSPTQYSPFGPNPALTFERQKEVLRLMELNGFITEEQKQAAVHEKITFAPNRTDIKAPHFVMYIRTLLEEKYGKELIEEGGLEVITTLDYSTQALAEEVVKEEVQKISSLNVKNAAALVITPETGEVLAMVGSKDYFDTKNDGNVNVTISPRQPGSSIKVVNYAYALSHGYTPATIIADTPVTFLVKGQPPYTPKNYEGGFRGNLPVRNALAESRNVVAVKVLASYGVENMIDMGRRLGITSWENPENYGLSLTLGGGEVKLIDLARVYATIANYGKRPEITSILRVSNNKGEVLEENGCIKTNPPMIARFKELTLNAYASESGQITQEGKEGSCLGQQVLDERVAYLLVDILKDNKARTPAFGANSSLVISNHGEVAVKTGTSNDLRDNLTVGFNQKYLVAVWVGNNDASPMARIASGITGAAPIFHKIMSVLLASEAPHEWEVPTGLVQLPICTLTGTLPCEGCATRLEWFLEENAPERACNPEYIKQLKGPDEGEILEPAAQTEN